MEPLERLAQSNQAMRTGSSVFLSHSNMAREKSRGEFRFYLFIFITFSFKMWHLTLARDESQVHVYRSKTGACAAFLSNFDPTFSTKLTFQNVQYDLPPWSISILPDCKTAVYNTARVRKTNHSDNETSIPLLH